jgi:tetratricopeptide (TPR) repeat protein
VDEGETLARAALAHRFEGRDELASRAFGVQMFFLRREQGRLDEHLEVAEGLAAQYHGAWHYTLAYIYAQLNRPAQAREQLEATRTDDLPRDVYWLANLSVLCEVVAFLGDAPRAQRLYKLLLPYADRCIVVFALLCQGSASRLLGLLATTLSQLQEAERHFEHALTMNAQIRSPLWIAHTQHDYARMLLLRDRSGDRDKALELLTDALATAQQLGLTALADKARPLKLEVEAKGPAGV